MRDKIAQMLIVGFNGLTADEASPIGQAIMSHHLGGVILFDYDCQKQQKGRNIINPQQLRQLTESLQQMASESARQNQYTPLPLFISVDYEGGEVARLRDEYGFPKTLSCAELASLKEQDVIKQFDKMAQTLATHGINLNFAPVVDLSINVRNPIITKRQRAFSDDPMLVAKRAEQFIHAFHAHQIFCTLKHFPGHGSSDRDTHHGFVDITESWDPIELEPYRRLLSKPELIDMVMTGHVYHEQLDPAHPATLSKKIISGLLREKLGYQGVVVSDDLQMEAITHAYGMEDAVVRAVNAGCDLLVFGNQLVSNPMEPSKIIDIIEQAMLRGDISPDRIDSAYQRITHLKNKNSAELPDLKKQIG